MKLGIKASLERDSASEIIATHPAMAEVWFDATKTAGYSNLFDFMKRQPMDVGLHYWGALPNGLLTNIAYPDPSVTKPSLELIRATIDTAARHHFSYVNIHNDMRCLLHVNDDYTRVSIASKPAELTFCTENFLENIRILTAYANDRGIVLTIETVPLRDTTDWNAGRPRKVVINPYTLPMDVSLRLGALGYTLANDFGHTACNMISDDSDAVWQYLYRTTRTLAAATRLIHFGFIVPPYNGIDNHDSLDNPVLDTRDAIPNKKQMIELLKLFTNRDDVWILVEPKEDHVKNYFLARGILEKTGVLTK